MGASRQATALGVSTTLVLRGAIHAVSPLLVTLLVAPAALGVVFLRTMFVRAILVVPVVLTTATYSV